MGLVYGEQFICNETQMFPGFMRSGWDSFIINEVYSWVEKFCHGEENCATANLASNKYSSAWAYRSSSQNSHGIIVRLSNNNKRTQINPDVLELSVDEIYWVDYWWFQTAFWSALYVSINCSFFFRLKHRKDWSVSLPSVNSAPHLWTWPIDGSVDFQPIKLEKAEHSWRK